ncbi:MAG: hypothetical protein ACYDCD_00415 [Candidatus Acidiferrales bacterium]
MMRTLGGEMLCRVRRKHAAGGVVLFDEGMTWDDSALRADGRTLRSSG